MNRWALWRAWTLSCAAGEVIGIGIAAGIAGLLFATVGEPLQTGEKALVMGAMTAAGALEGVAVGFFQWRVLRTYLGSLGARAWIGATVGVAALGWLLGMLPSTFGPSSTDGSPSAVAVEPALAVTLFLAGAFGVAAGTVFGFAQWMVLQRHADRAHLWIRANALGWGVALPLIYVAAAIPTTTTPLLAKIALGIGGGLLAGLSVGAITGLFLLRISPCVGRLSTEHGPRPARAA